MAPPRELPKGGEPVNEGGRSVGASTVIPKGVAKPTVGVGCVPSVSAPYGVKMVDLAKDLVLPRAWRPRGVQLHWVFRIRRETPKGVWQYRRVDG